MIEAQHDATARNPLSCVACGKVSCGPMPFMGWRTDDGFYKHYPTCRHGQYLGCPECEAKSHCLRCPVCGSMEEYT